MQSAVAESIKLQLTVANYNYANTTVINLMHLTTLTSGLSQ